MLAIVSTIIALILLILLRILFLICMKPKKSPKRNSCKLMVVFGSGGHTSEMEKLMKSLSLSYSPVIYIYAKSDRGSLNKIKEIERERGRNSNEEFHLIQMNRSREVGQSWITTLFTTAKACFHALYIVFQHKPDLILCNGPGTCIPICGVAYLYKVFFILNTKIMFVESICRVRSLSLSGKILYFFADHFLVHWKQLHEKYPRSEYIGRIL